MLKTERDACVCVCACVRAFQARLRMYGMLHEKIREFSVVAVRASVEG